MKEKTMKDYKLHISSNKPHSIKEVVISFVVKPELEDLEGYENLMSEGGSLHSKYNIFEKLNIVEKQFDSKNLQMKKERKYVSGFRFSDKAEDGTIRNVIQGQTRNRIKSGLFTFHTLNYDRWTNFITSCISDAKAIAGYKDIYEISEAGLLYIDEFYFAEVEYKPEQIFRVGSKHLPQGMFDSDIADYKLSTNKNCGIGGYTDIFSIQVYNDLNKKTIRITDDMHFGLQKMSLRNFLNDADPERLFRNFKEANHELLKEVLSDNALSLIKLK